MKGLFVLCCLCLSFGSYARIISCTGSGVVIDIDTKAETLTVDSSDFGGEVEELNIAPGTYFGNGTNNSQFYSISVSPDSNSAFVFTKKSGRVNLELDCR